MATSGAPPTNCGIIPGSAAKLYVTEAPEVGPIVWKQVGDIDNYTVTNDATDTSLNTAGWIRSLPMERGMSITAAGKLNSKDPGQIAVDKQAAKTGCDALTFFRLVIPGAIATDQPYLSIGFWAWANKQDVAAASTDPFSWGVELRVWAPPITLDASGQPGGPLIREGEAAAAA